jgi:hypothetical protein
MIAFVMSKFDSGEILSAIGVDGRREEVTVCAGKSGKSVEKVRRQSRGTHLGSKSKHLHVNTTTIEKNKRTY